LNPQASEEPSLTSDFSGLAKMDARLAADTANPAGGGGNQVDEA